MRVSNMDLVYLGGSLPLEEKIWVSCGRTKTKMLFLLLHVITFSSYLAVQSLALQNPKNCFNQGLVCGNSREYPMKYLPESSNSCGYPSLEVDCNSRGKAVMNISSHIYQVLDVDYRDKQMRLLDIDMNTSDCPQPKRNFSLPSSPSWVNYSLPTFPNYNLIVFYNCSSIPVEAGRYLLCSDEYYRTSNSPPSYAFNKRDMPKRFDWYANCDQNVVVPGYYSGGVNYRDMMKVGFVLKWSAVDWCGDCERSGGQCWSSSLSNSTATGCACKDNNSYDRTCPPLQSPPRQQGVPPIPSTDLKSENGMSIGLKIGIGVLAGIGGLVLLVMLIFFGVVNHSFLSIFHQKNENKSQNNVEVLLEGYGCLALHRYKYLDIKKMTNSFKEPLGQGAYGRVFKGELHDGRLVAVKVLNKSNGNSEDFINELTTIGRTNHVNVVNLVGFCIEGTQRALVCEFMPNGSLERFIYTQKESSTTLPLGWDKLYQIALGIARGLEYLHRGCNTRILHFDIKPHNILLDENFCPKITDFGLAKLYPTRESTVSTVGARGTMGYIAPELCCRAFGNASHKSDVYSYGMMMLEMIGGRKNFDMTKDKTSEIYFPLWIYDHFKRYNDVEGLKELQVREVLEDEKAKKMIMVALWCIQAHPMDRPSMSKVVEMLEGHALEVQMPPSPSIDPRTSSFILL